MNWFGPNWHAAVNSETDECPVPRDKICEWCGEGFYHVDDNGTVTEDRGFLIRHGSIHHVMAVGFIAAEAETMVAYHLECHVRSIAGSVAHQQKRCSCYGGTGEDDPALTKRQAAEAAAKYLTEDLILGGGYED